MRDMPLTYEERRWRELLQLEIRHTQQVEAKGRYLVGTEPEYHYGADSSRLRDHTVPAVVQAVPEAHPLCQTCPSHLQCMLDVDYVCCVSQYCTKEWDGERTRIAWMNLYAEWPGGQTKEITERGADADGVYRIPEMAIELFKVMKERRERLRTEVGLTDRSDTDRTESGSN